MSATGYTTGDPQKVDVTGDTMTGDLTLSGSATDLSVGGNATVTGTTTVSYGASFSAPVGKMLASMLSTCVLSGGEISVNGSDPSKIDITAMNGVIIGGTPAAPTFTEINLAAQTGLAALNTTPPVSVTHWLVDSTGTIVRQATDPTNEQRRNLIKLGGSVLAGGATTIVDQTLPVQQWQLANQLVDLFFALGTFSTTGNRVSAAGANLQLNKTSGALFQFAFNLSPSGQSNPHVSAVPAMTPMQLRYATHVAGSQAAATVTNVDVANYAPGGVITAVPGGANTSTIQEIYLFATNDDSTRIGIQYGQVAYASLDEAEMAMGSGPTANPEYALNGALICQIAVTKTATALNDTTQARIKPRGRFAQA